MDLSDVERLKERERVQNAVLSLTKVLLISGEISKKVARSYLHAVHLSEDTIDNTLEE